VIASVLAGSKGYMQTFLVHSRRPLHMLRWLESSAFSASCFSSAAPCSPESSIHLLDFLYVWLVSLTLDSNPLFPQIPIPELVQPAHGKWCIRLLEHDRSDPARLAQPHSVEPHGLGLLGADVYRRLPGALQLFGALLLEQDPAWRVAAHGRKDRIDEEALCERS